jgi:hypothetical protein
MHQIRSGRPANAALLLSEIKRWRSEAEHEALDRSDSCGEHNLFQRRRVPATNRSQQHRTSDQGGDGTRQRATKAWSTGREPEFRPSQLQTTRQDLFKLKRAPGIARCLRASRGHRDQGSGDTNLRSRRTVVSHFGGMMGWLWSPSDSRAAQFCGLGKCWN